MGGAGHVIGAIVVSLAVLLPTHAGAETLPHPLHISTAQLLVEESAIYVRIRMFKDDLEGALAAHSGRALLALAPTAEIDSIFLSYVEGALELRVDGSSLTPEVLSSGIDLESGEGDMRVWWYLLAFDLDGPFRELAIRNSVLFDRFDDQRNVVRVLHAATEAQRTLYFAAPEDDPASVRFD